MNKHLQQQLARISTLSKELKNLEAQEKAIAKNSGWYDQEYIDAVKKRKEQIEEWLEPIKKIKLWLI
jgi:predicted transcriptional regulator